MRLHLPVLAAPAAVRDYKDTVGRATNQINSANKPAGRLDTKNNPDSYPSAAKGLLTPLWDQLTTVRAFFSKRLLAVHAFLSRMAFIHCFLIL
jgi:hypothetical protein